MVDTEAVITCSVGVGAEKSGPGPDKVDRDVSILYHLRDVL